MSVRDGAVTALDEQAALDARGLRIHARRDLSTVLAGAYRSAFRGRGLTFEELRDYTPGDEVRWIEWNATARLGRPIVKRMREERDLVLCLLADLSDSLDFGYGGDTKRAAVRRAAAALAAAAIAANDRVAVATFAGGPGTLLAPAAGPLQLERVFRALARTPSRSRRGTDARGALDWTVDTLPRHTVIVILSDLLFPDPGASLRNSARKHEVVALRVRDPADELPAGIASVRARPAEEGPVAVLRTSRRRRRSVVDGALDDISLRSLGIDVGSLWTGAHLIPSLHRFFEQRAGRAA